MPPIETTFAMIKSKGRNHTDLVFSAIIASHFVIIRAQRMDLTSDQIAQLYAEHYDKSYFPDLCDSVGHGVVVIAMQRENAIRGWRELMGPTNPRHAREMHIRYQARHEPRMADNIVHGSDSPQSVLREMTIVFGPEWVDRALGSTRA